MYSGTDEHYKAKHTYLYYGQCDQMSTLFVQYLAIVDLDNIIKSFQFGLKILTITKNH